MQTNTASFIKSLHFDLWFFSIWILIGDSLAIYTGNISWLTIFSILGMIYWIARHFIQNIEITFPYSTANIITMTRSASMIVSIGLYQIIPEFLLGCLLSVICLSDILDGYFARKENKTSLIGEYMDKETDALFVLSITTLLYLKQYTGIWILWMGWIRYIYFIFMYFRLKSDQKEIKDDIAKIIAIILFICLNAPLLVAKAISFPMVITSSVLLAFSFGRGIWLELKS